LKTMVAIIILLCLAASCAAQTMSLTYSWAPGNPPADAYVAQYAWDSLPWTELADTLSDTCCLVLQGVPAGAMMVQLRVKGIAYDENYGWLESEWSEPSEGFYSPLATAPGDPGQPQLEGTTYHPEAGGR